MNFLKQEDVDALLSKNGINAVSNIWSEDLKGESDIIIFLDNPIVNSYDKSTIKSTLEKLLPVTVVKTANVEYRKHKIFDVLEMWVWCDITSN